MSTLSVDEHIWHHLDPRKRGPKELTGMINSSHDKTRARLRALVPARSEKTYPTWLAERGDNVHNNVTVAVLDLFAGYKTPINDTLGGRHRRTRGVPQLPCPSPIVPLPPLSQRFDSVSGEDQQPAKSAGDNPYGTKHQRSPAR